MNATHLTRSRIKKLCRNRLRQWVITLLLIARHQVISLLRNHTIKFRYFVGRVLQVCIHRYNHTTTCSTETTEQSRTLAVVTTELYAMHMLGILRGKVFYHLPRIVRTTIVHKNNLKCKVVRLHHTLYPSIKFRKALCLVKERHHNRYVVFIIHFIDINVVVSVKNSTSSCHKRYQNRNHRAKYQRKIHRHGSISGSAHTLHSVY